MNTQLTINSAINFPQGGCRQPFLWFDPNKVALTQGQQLRLQDGRRLGFAEFGDPGGKPVFFFHGLPGSRLFRHPDESIVTSLRVRLITIDRPGFGYSDVKPGRTLLDWPADVVALADALGIGKFAVAGVSAGGPYTAACAYKIPERLSGVALVSSAGPTGAPQAKKGMSPQTRISFETAGCGCVPWWFLYPATARLAQVGRTQPEKLWQRTATSSLPPDRDLLLDPAVKAIFLESFPETYRRGPRPHITDALLIARNWGFQVSDISIKVHLWHGTADVHAPPGMGRYLADTIPQSEATFLPDEGHLLMFKPDYWRGDYGNADF